jgi:hypothetical protein
MDTRRLLPRKKRRRHDGATPSKMLFARAANSR